MAITLAKRERYFVSIGACLIAIFFIFQFLVSPFFEKRDRLRKEIVKQEQDLKDLADLIAKYNTYKQNSSNIDRVLAGRGKGFTLISFLEKATGETRIDKEHIKYYKPSTSKGSGPYDELMVEMKLEGITLDQLVRYLYRIEHPDDLVFVKRLSITDNRKEEGYLDSIIQVVTFQ